MLEYSDDRHQSDIGFTLHNTTQRLTSTYIRRKYSQHRSELIDPASQPESRIDIAVRSPQTSMFSFVFIAVGCTMLCILLSVTYF